MKLYYIYLVVFHGASSKHLEVENNILYFCSKSKISNFPCVYVYLLFICIYKHYVKKHIYMCMYIYKKQLPNNP